MTVAQPSLEGIRDAGMPFTVPASTLVAGGLEPEGEVAAMPLPFASDGFTVGFAGRLIEAKGWRVLTDALPADARLVLAGDGPQRAELEALAAANDRSTTSASCRRTSCGRSTLRSTASRCRR